MVESAPNQRLPYVAALVFAGLNILVGLACIALAAVLLSQADSDRGLVIFSALGGLVFIGIGLALPGLHRRQADELRASNGVRKRMEMWIKVLITALVWFAAAGLGFYEKNSTVGWLFLAGGVAFLALGLRLRSRSRSEERT